MKKASAFRTTALLLTLLTVLPAAVSCGEAAESPVKTDTPVTEAAVTTEETEPDSLAARKNVSDDVPALDFGGEEFRIFYQKRYTTDAIPESAEENGEVLNDAVLARNRSMEERFNVKVIGIEGEEDAMVNTLMNSVRAGDDMCDLFMGHSIYSSKAALNGYFYNWYDIPYVDFKKPWFPQYAIEGLTVNGRMYMAVADMCLSMVSNAYCMFFNKQIAADLDYEDIYQTVKDGQWTVDRLASLTKDVYSDVNGDGKKDAGDRYGFASRIGNTTTTYLFSCDVPTVSFNDDGTVTSVFLCERAQNLVTKLRELYKVNPGTYTKDDDYMLAFENGNALFLACTVDAAEDEFRNLNFDYGIIPFPKYDEAQENYYTIPGGSVSCLTTPVTAGNLEKVGALTAAFCRESWVSVLPAYYDIVLKVKGARDETSIEMLDLIMDGRLVNAAFIYDAFSGYTYKMGSLIDSNKELASFCASNDKAVLKHFQKVMDLFYEDHE